MAVGKRLSASDPLTEHDVAARLDKAALRVLQIMQDVRQTEGGTTSYPTFQEAVKASRYTTGILNHLAFELERWGVRPIPLKGDEHEEPV